MNLRLVNLCLALVWLSLAVGLFAEEWATDRPRWVIPIGPGVSVAWVALALAAYNFLRWLLVGYRERSRAPRPLSTLERPLRRTTEQRERPADYDPNFDFSRPAEPAKPPSDQGFPPPAP